MSKKPAALPLFGDAYLADTTHLTTEEHGAYLLLMIAAWRQEDCGLPNDDRKLARIVGLSPRKWAAMRDTIMEFWQVESGRIYQSRLRKEHDFVCKKSEQNRSAAEARWKAQESENKQDGGMRPQSKRNAPPPPPIREEEEPKGSPSPLSPPASAKPGVCEAVIAAWNSMAAQTVKPNHLPTCSITPKRRQSCNARLREHDLAAIQQALDRIPRCSFLLGNNDRSWKADIDWLLKPDSVTRILEGKYDDRPAQHPGHTPHDTRDGFTRALDRELERLAAQPSRST